MIVIADTGPLNYLILIGAAEVLPVIFGRVAVPGAVARELQCLRAPEPMRSWIAAPPRWLELHMVAAAEKPGLAHLGAGEREAILLGQELHPDWLILDDADGRREAARRQLPVMGTLRVLDEAAIRGLIDLRATLAQLEQTAFFVSPDLKQWLLTRQAERDRRP